MSAAGFAWTDSQLKIRAESLATRLGLPHPRPWRGGPGVCLVLTPAGLELRAPGCGPVRADWTAGRTGFRLRRGGGRRQHLARAFGLHRRRAAPVVVDATAGLGRDACVLAALGCRVTALERSPWVYALLEDAWRRAAGDHRLGSALCERLHLIRAEAVAWLDGLDESERPAAVYLDPMHPPRRKSALVRKEMRVLREVAGSDPDAPALFAAARRAARERVVVKRPAGAPELAPAPDHCVAGRSTRFDVYLPAPS